MNKFFIIILLTFVSCGGSKPGGSFPSGCKPYDLSVEVDSGRMIVYWKKECPRTTGGYNIYISQTPLAPEFEYKQIPPEIAPFNSAPFPGDTNPDDSIETFEALGLVDGRKYYVSVRILLPDGTQSKPTKEVLAVCGPSGEFELSIRFKSEQDGYSFSTEQFVRADNEQNDVYYYFAEGVDYLSSPKRLNGFLKDMKFKHLPFSGGLDEVKNKVRQLDSIPTEERLPIITGDWIWAMSPGKKSTLIKVLGFTGNGEERKARLFYLHSTVPDELFF